MCLMTVAYDIHNKHQFKLQNMLKNYYYYYIPDFNRLKYQMVHDEYEHLELIRNSQTMTDQDKKTLAEFSAYAKPKLSEIIGVKNVPITPCERYTNGITVNVLLKVKHFDSSFDEYKKYFQKNKPIVHTKLYIPHDNTQHIRKVKEFNYYLLKTDLNFAQYQHMVKEYEKRHYLVDSDFMLMENNNKAARFCNIEDLGKFINEKMNECKTNYQFFIDVFENEGFRKLRGQIKDNDKKIEDLYKEATDLKEINRQTVKKYHEAFDKLMNVNKDFEKSTDKIYSLSDSHKNGKWEIERNEIPFD